MKFSSRADLLPDEIAGFDSAMWKEQMAAIRETLGSIDALQTLVKTSALPAGIAGIDIATLAEQAANMRALTGVIPVQTFDPELAEFRKWEEYVKQHSQTVKLIR
jgi:hypothetical protein